MTRLGHAPTAKSEAERREQESQIRKDEAAAAVQLELDKAAKAKNSLNDAPVG